MISAKYISLLLIIICENEAETDWWAYVSNLAPIMKNDSRNNVLRVKPFKSYPIDHLIRANDVALQNGFSDFEQYFKNNPNLSLSDYAKLQNFSQFSDVFERYQIRFDRSYREIESPLRQVQVLGSMKSIKNNNLQNRSFNLGLTSLTDRTMEEFGNRLGVKIPNEELNNSSKNFENYRTKRSSNPLPENFDWREKGVVYPIEDQGECMSCWAFATTSALESHYVIKHGKQRLRRLSVQQLLDCAHDGGCKVGFWPKDAMKFVIDNKNGLVSSADSYPYSNPPKAGTCHTTEDQPVKIESFVSVAKNSEDEVIQKALYDNGPLTVVLKFDAFQNYRKGVIFYVEECVIQGTHAVTLIGWGTDPIVKKNYWLIKNSFGPDWGEGGYLRVERKDNICLLKKWVTYPVVQ